MTEAWLVAGVVVAPALVWLVCEGVRAARERIAARRIIRKTWGDGHP